MKANVKATLIVRIAGRPAFAAKAAACLLVLCFLIVQPYAANPSAQAAGNAPSRFIAIVYDDSGSMRYDGGRDILKNYIYANYSLQNLVALMDDSDSAKVYLISKDGRDPVDVKKQKDLNGEFRGVTAAKSADTFAGTINAALKDGAAFLRDHADGRFLFILITDGDTMYDDQDRQISGSLKGLFDGYIRLNGLDAQSGRARALLLSIGPDKPLAPVSDMESALMGAGIYTQPFIADIIGKSQSEAGNHIRSAMTDLAESMASTNMMTVEPGKPFAVRYPLESMVVMEQSQQGSAIQSISGGGEELDRTTLYRTKALGGVNLSSTFSSITSRSGSVKPGQYTLQATGNVKVSVFSKVGFKPDITLADGTGRTLAEYRDDRWNVPGVSLRAGDKLSAAVKFTALDGTNVDIGPYVQLGFGKTGAFSCTATGQGSFELNGISAGQGYLNIGLSDSDYFQLTIPALPVNIVSEDAAITQSPELSAQPSAQPTPTAAQAANQEKPAFDAESLLSLPGNDYAVEYTSSREYVQAAEISLPGTRSAQLQADISPAPPKGLQIRLNGVVFDSAHTSGAVDTAGMNRVELLVNADFAAADRQLYELRFNSGETLSINVTPKPRALRIEAVPSRLEFGVLDSAASTPSCTWKVSIRESGQWRDASAASDNLSVRAEAPAGLNAQCDAAQNMLHVSSGWPQAFSPVGESDVLLSASTGKPGETASLSIDVNVHDDVRRWIWFLIEAAALILATGYTVMIVRKRRIPLEFEAYAGGNADMSDAQRVDMERNLTQRNFWPFGKEVCKLGLLEVYPHEKERSLVVLSSVAVQYGLKIDGKAPQYHKKRDQSGDFVIGPNNVVGVREDGSYRYYKFVNPGLKAKKAGRSGSPQDA